MPEIICVGGLVADVVGSPIDHLPARGQLALIDRIELHIGGCAANTAMGLAKLGVETAVIGRVGADGFGDFLLQTMRQAGVNTDYVARDPHTATAAALVLRHSDGERSFLHALGCSAALQLADIPFDLVSRSRLLHVASALILPGLDGEPMAELLRQAKAAGVLTSLDTAWDSCGLWMRQIGPCLPHTDYFLPSFEEAKMLTPGLSTPEEIAQALLDAGANVVGLKMGAQGAYICSKNGLSQHLPALAVPVVDTNGAGDTFVSGFLAGVLRGWDLETCARFANAVGASCVMAVGATTGIRSFDETLALMEQYQ